MNSPKKRALILINKTAGMKQGHDETFELASFAARSGYESVVYPIIPGTDLTSETIISEYEGKTDLIICVGGDGTLNHVMNSVMGLKEQERPVVGYVPSGSTNDFAKCLGIPENSEDAVRTAVKGRAFSYDVGQRNSSYFNYVAAFGAFSEISYDTDQSLKNVLGYAAYVINAIINLPKNVGYGCKMSITADGEHFEGEYVFGAVCNSVSLGGMKLFGNEDVKLNDGKMELLLIRAPKNIVDLNLILSSLALGSVNDPHISFRQVQEVSFHSDMEVSWTLDGEFGGKDKDTDIRVIKKAMKIKRRQRRSES